VNYALVGAFVLFLSGVLVAGILWLASGGLFQKDLVYYWAFEDESVAGLNLNAPVKYQGVNVGKVETISLDPNNPERVILLLAIEQGTPIQIDTIATLKTQGLTGIAYLELSGSKKGSPTLQVTANNAYPVIPTKPSLNTRLENVLTELIGKMNSTTGNFSAISADVKRFTGETLPALEHLISELNVLAVSLRHLTDQTERNPTGLLFGRKPMHEGPGESAHPNTPNTPAAPERR
jgi:phospholipid/cholesterol/gamma-HCH transport system substrate-binding protein